MSPMTKQEIKVILDFTGVAPRELFSRARTMRVCRARKAIARELSNRGLSSTQIGKVLGRDHTAVLDMIGSKRCSKR